MFCFLISKCLNISFTVFVGLMFFNSNAMNSKESTFKNTNSLLINSMCMRIDSMSLSEKLSLVIISRRIKRHSIVGYMIYLD